MRNQLMPLLALTICLPALAVNTDRWEVKTPADFMRGKLQQLTVTSDAGIQLGYPTTRLGDFAKEIWCSTVTSNGIIWFGTGSPADIYALDLNNQPTNVFKTEAIAVTALVADPQGNLFAATLAEGRIFKIQPNANPAGSEFCRLLSPYIWALVMDKEGTLFAATGPQGKIYRITPDGKSEEWYVAEDANIISLAVDKDGSLLAGSGERGLLYRVLGKNNAVVLHEFEEDEVKSLVISGDTLFVGVNKQKMRHPRNAGARRAKTAEFEELTQRLSAQYGIHAPATPEDEEFGTPAAERVDNALAGALYHRNPNGRMDRWANWESESILHLAVDGAGRVLAAMATHGRVYRVPDSQRWELLFDLDEQQALTLAIRSGNLAFIGTGHIGAGYIVGTQTAPTGEYTSEVYDTKFLTTWGNLHWQGSGPITIATRAGNTALPDKTWSEWSSPVNAAAAKVSSPQARFIQVRTHLAQAANAQLRSFALYSQTQNQKPEVTAITFGEKASHTSEKIRTKELAPAPTTPEEDPESALASALETATPKPEPTRPKLPESAKQINWVASDKDGDTLMYRLFYRAQGDDLWLPVSRDKQPLRKTEYRWDTESIPDAWYHVKVVASDEEANPPGSALLDEKTSDPIRIDNGRPDILDLTFNPANSTLTGRARDNLSLIRTLEFSLDGDEWKRFAPQDGVLDDRDEPFALTLTLDPGPHTIAVRATDEDGNPGVAKTLVRSK